MTFSSDDIIRALSATPDLEGEESARLMEDIEHVCSPEEARRRIEAAQRFLRWVTRDSPAPDLEDEGDLLVSRLMTKRVDELPTKPLRKVRA